MTFFKRRTPHPIRLNPHFPRRNSARPPKNGKNPQFSKVFIFTRKLVKLDSEDGFDGQTWQFDECNEIYDPSTLRSPLIYYYLLHTFTFFIFTIHLIRFRFQFYSPFLFLFIKQFYCGREYIHKLHLLYLRYKTNTSKILIDWIGSIEIWWRLWIQAPLRFKRC